jgi:hypothetical protein
MGIRRSIPGGLIAVASPLSPPALGNLAAWFDITDSTTVFQDTAGTIQALNGDSIRNITNKGYDSTNVPHMNAFFAGSPAGNITLATNAVNGLQALENTVDGQTTPSSLSTAGTLAAMPNGGTLAAVCKREGTGFQLNFLAPNSLNDFIVLGASGTWSVEVANCGEKNTSKTIVANEWIYAYCTCDSAGNATWRAAGQTEQSSSGNPFVSRVNGVNLSPQDAQWTEILYWDRALTTGEKAEFITYTTNKYGTLPHT